MDQFTLSDLQRRMANMLRLANVAELDEANRRVRVTFGNITSAWLSWPAEIGRNFVRWRPLRVGQQVVIGSPSGELNQAKIIAMTYSDAVPPPSDNPNVDLIEFTDGTQLQYDVEAHQLTANVKGAVDVTTDGDVTATVGGELSASVSGAVTVTSGATAYVESASGATVKAPTITLDGNVVVTGSLSQGAGGGANATFGGSITAQGDVVGEGISLKNHVHTEQGDGAPTSPPIP